MSDQSPHAAQDLPRTGGDASLTRYDLMPADSERLHNTFTYHAPFGDQPLRYHAIRQKAKELATLIMTLTPPSRERSLALTELEYAIFNANAAIARNEKPDATIGLAHTRGDTRLDAKPPTVGGLPTGDGK